MILVVGGAGYVGSVLVRELLERGYAVKVFDRLYYGDQGIREVLERIKLEPGDIRTMDSSVLNGVDAVINLSGLSNDPTAEYNPKANFEMNTQATEYLARLCKKRGIRRFLYASSCSIYDVGIGNDERDVVLDEESPVSPKAAYSSSKYQAERLLLSLKGEDFSPVILRKGTIYGFSPRMRYDLVVNTFLKDVLSKGHLTIHYGGEMWRPLVDVRDAARAYITCLEAKESKVQGEIFNVVYGNFRISELALRVIEALRGVNIKPELRADYRYHGVRSYRVSGKKIERVLDFMPAVSVEEAVKDMVENIQRYRYTDFDNPRYSNIAWMKVLEEADKITKVTGSVFDTVGHTGFQPTLVNAMRKKQGADF
jgi:nucleoside-diphosphate-sugar epimerase